ncbi:DUF397 domain-containing protein [Sphaerisporangium sp. NPDC088356]|uniref:DUF397 domain-containing protein n=1 Tax=Sphaerisporangium sp. NPDC088356 TaxID=3154871 RepID=UPI0034207424
MDLSRAEWRKSTHSSGDGNDCVEVATSLSNVIAVRDSKNPDGPKLIFTQPEWHAFIAGVKGCDLDL